MHSSNGSPQDECGVSVSACAQPACPVCNGTLVPLRGLYRCSRCYYTLCVGCEDVPGYPPDVAAD